MSQTRRIKVVVAGAGPAGSSLSVRLAAAGHDVTLLDRGKFPRHKLCGEFISPECLNHFAELGLEQPMLDAGGTRIRRTRFFDVAGRWTEVPSVWLGDGRAALSLSRAAMDHLLVTKAAESGVEVLEETTVVSGTAGDGRLQELRVRTASGPHRTIRGDVFIDATGRAGVVGRFSNGGPTQPSKTKGFGLVGFKAHLGGVELDADCCDVYSFPGGYGGISRVENGIANHCFLVRAETARRHSGDVDAIVDEHVFRNPHAAGALRRATVEGRWHAVAVDGFGIKNLCPAKNVFTVGDSAAFIDPFTGSGMLMALQSSRLLAGLLANGDNLDSVARKYKNSFGRMFRRRLMISALFRRAAFNPRLAALAVRGLTVSSALTEWLVRGTRSGTAPSG